MPLLWVVNVWHFWPVLRYGSDEIIVKCASRHRLSSQAVPASSCRRCVSWQETVRIIAFVLASSLRYAQAWSSLTILTTAASNVLLSQAIADTKRSALGFIVSAVVFLPWPLLFAIGAPVYFVLLA